MEIILVSILGWIVYEQYKYSKEKHKKRLEEREKKNQGS